MLYFKNIRFFTTFLIIVSLFSIVSCTAPRKVVYLYNIQDTSLNLKDTNLVKLRSAQINFENPIQKNDQLWITVGGSNLADLVVVNSANGIVPGSASASTTGSGGASTGYLVEADGKIKIPYLGAVQAEGLTRLQLEAFLTEQMKEYTKNPVVNVRFMNYNFSVLGEVSKPGRFSMPTERITILEALGMAGDLNEMAKRENVLVVREINGQREFARVNLLSKDLFNSQFYYLKTNDVIYVEPVKNRFIARTGVPQYISIVAVGISLLLTIVNLIK